MLQVVGLEPHFFSFVGLLLVVAPSHFYSCSCSHAAGTCVFGDRCYYAHTGESAAAAGTSEFQSCGAAGPPDENTTAATGKSAVADISEGEGPVIGGAIVPPPAADSVPAPAVITGAEAAESLGPRRAPCRYFQKGALHMKPSVERLQRRDRSS